MSAEPNVDRTARELTEARPRYSFRIAWDRARDPAPRWLAPEPLPHGLSVHREGEAWALFDGALARPAPRVPRPGESPAACAMRAYREGGAAAFGELRGSFTLALWDPAKEQLLLERDALGMGTCFLSSDAPNTNGGRELLSVALDDLLDVAPRRGLCRPYLAEYVSGYAVEEHLEETFFEGVRRLLPGHRLTLGRRARRLERTWEPVGERMRWASEEEAAGFEEVLQRAVDRCLNDGGDTLALSGGFDSVAIAALAARSPALKAPLQAISLRFLEEGCDESPTQRAVAEALGMPLLLRATRPDRAFMSLALDDWVATSGPSLSIFQALYSELLDEARERGCGHMLTGSGGDELLSVDPCWSADRILAGDLVGLVRHYRALRRSSPLRYRAAYHGLWVNGARAVIADRARRLLLRGWPGGLQMWRRRGKRPVEVADPALRRTLAERRRRLELSPVPAEGLYVAGRRSLLISPLVMIERDQSRSWTRARGFRHSSPFYDRDVVDLVLRLHPRTLMEGGYAKAPLRALVRRRLPGVEMVKRKVDFTASADRLMRGPGRQIWQEFGGPRLLSDELGILDRGSVEAFMGAYFRGEQRAAYGAWLLLSTERWLRALAAQGRV